MSFARGYARWIVEATGFPRLDTWLTNVDPRKPVTLRMRRGPRVPGRVVHLADLALLAGAGAELSQIDGEMVQSVHQDLAAVEV